MKYEVYAQLALQSPKSSSFRSLISSALASDFVDIFAYWFYWAAFCEATFESKGAKNKTKERYIKRVVNSLKQEDVDLAKDINKLLELNFQNLPSKSWLAIEVEFELLRPWYSRDDRPMHVLDNPLRKDRVFGVPFMSAAAWKGLLRWACRMHAGLRQHLEQHRQFEGWKDPEWIVHLFGNPKGEREHFSQGALVFYPTWFSRIGFEVINPHSRETRAGRHPIYYEVVPPGTKATLRLLYAPWPGMQPAVEAKEAIPPLLKAIKSLLETYGISAKRTAGWGTARPLGWKLHTQDNEPLCKQTFSDFWREAQKVLS